jgi:predicted AlkP superfamily phosphohydrolase/phosphomutase
MISGFPLPDVRGVYTYPAGFKKEVASVVDYIADVGDFRTGDKRRVLDEVTEMTRRRFELARYLLEHKPWDFFMMVEMGTDRVVHLLWRHIDPDHRRYDPDHLLAAAVKDYYRLCDELVARLLEPYRADPETVTAVVSDHGARAMEGGVRINEWLLRNGYLTLHRRPSEPLSMSRAIADGLVDWSQTRAWAEGGYYSRLMVNVKGREPQGIVAPGEVSPLLEQIAAGVAAIPDDLGRKMATRACRPEEIYREVKNIPPDLMIFFGDLGWRAIGGILPDENAPLHVFENDAGPDDANHNWDGVFIMAGGGIAPRRDPLRLDILDFAPTVLSRLGLEVPADMAGEALVL